MALTKKQRDCRHVRVAPVFEVTLPKREMKRVGTRCVDCGRITQGREPRS